MSRDHSPNDWQQLQGLVDQVLDAPVADRARLLDHLSGGDTARHEALSRFVAECERDHRFLERPAAERFAALFAGESPGLPAVIAERYRLTRELGRGGMAVVYLARDIKHDRDVAVKVIRPELAVSLGRPRFLREIAIVAQLHHPHIVPLYDSGEVDGVLYYVMPYEAGHSLRHKLARTGELPIPDAVRVLRDVADAMAHAHQHGVVHRDIKPENVLLSDRHALVTDFGVAKAVSDAADRQAITTVGVALGTPAYMAPEQVAADPSVDHRADIYAFGALAYELLTGAPPFVRPTPQGVLGAHMTEPAEPVTQRRAAIPAPLGALVMRCLEKKPADRWQRAEDLLGALEALASTSPAIPVPVVSPRRRWGSWTAIGVAGLAAASLGAVLWRINGTRDALDPSRVAVVRFENLTGSDSLETFGAILADMITNGLSRSEVVSVVPAASVAASTSVDGRQRLPVDPNALARDTRAGLVVLGSYFLRADSLRIQAQIVDVGRDRPLAPLPLVTVSPAAQEQGILAVQERVLVALLGRMDPSLRQIGAHSDLPMSLAAYREYAAGIERGGFRDLGRALEHFYRAIRLDSTSNIAILRAALEEWRLNFNLPKVDSLLRIVESHKAGLAPFDLAYLEWLRAYLDGDLEAGLRVTRRWSDAVGGFPNPAVQANFRLNRLDEAYTRAMAILETPVYRRETVSWTYLSDILHARGKHGRELREVRKGIKEFEAVGASATALLEVEIRALAALGRLEELLPRLSELRATDPTSRMFRDAGRELRWHGHPAAADEISRRAVQWYRAALAASPTRSLRIQLAETLFDLELWDEARGMFEKLAAEPLPAEFTSDHGRNLDVLLLGYLGIDAARRGDTTAAEAMIQRLGAYKRPYLLGSNIQWQARIAGQLGQCERAVGLLQDAVRKGSSITGSVIRESPEFASLRGCSAFHQLMQPVG